MIVELNNLTFYSSLIEGILMVGCLSFGRMKLMIIYIHVHVFCKYSVAEVLYDTILSKFI